MALRNDVGLADARTKNAEEAIIMSHEARVRMRSKYFKYVMGAENWTVFVTCRPVGWLFHWLPLHHGLIGVGLERF
jgi:hypothetical protein